MIDFNVLARRIMKKCQCDEADALSSLAQAYLTLDRTKPEPMQASYLFITACYDQLDKVSMHDKYTRELESATRKLQRLNSSLAKEDQVTMEELSIAPKEPESDHEYLMDITKHLSEDNRIAVLVVAHDLLSSRNVNRKPLTVEMTRQLLKRHKIPNTSEYARQVYTFLTTLKV